MTLAGDPRGPAIADPASSVRRLHAAMLTHAQVQATRHGRLVRFCPHALGWRGDAAYVLGFMIQPDPTLPAARGTWGQWFRLWQWLPVADLDALHAVEGAWVLGARWGRRALGFLDRVERGEPPPHLPAPAPAAETAAS